MNFIEIQQVTKQYGNHKVLDNVSLSVPKGKIYGLLGPNGAGKTSLIRIITQITAPDSGQILFDGEKLAEKHIYKMGYLPEERGLYKKMKVGEQLIYLARLKGLSRTGAQDTLKYWALKLEIPDWLSRPVEDLSKGMQQKVQFIATVMHDPQVIILDEPFTGFDPLNANIIRDEILALKALGKTIIFSTHRMETVEDLCDSIALINRSRIVLESTKKALKSNIKPDIYHVEGTGALGNLPDGYQVLTHIKEEDGFKAEIKIIEGHSADLIRLLADRLTIRLFSEKVPSINDIFIKTVSENQ